MNLKPKVRMNSSLGTVGGQTRRPRIKNRQRKHQNCNIENHEYMLFQEEEGNVINADPENSKQDEVRETDFELSNLGNSNYSKK